jgi:UDPglucose 6-dehydrogenase
LAQRITFINQIANLCEENGADVQEVIEVIGHDKRIGSHYWYPGLGYGGSCFPKDVRELAAYSRSVNQGDNLFNKINELNENRIFKKLNDFSRKVGGWSGKTVAVLGLSFKPHTDDLREAPSLKVIPQLLHDGAKVMAYDPMAIPMYKQWNGEQANVTFTESIAEACTRADVVMLLIEWPEVVEFDYSQLPALPDQKPRWFIDTRNQVSPEVFSPEMWHYISIGR